MAAFCLMQDATGGVDQAPIEPPLPPSGGPGTVGLLHFQMMSLVKYGITIIDL